MPSLPHIHGSSPSAASRHQASLPNSEKETLADDAYTVYRQFMKEFPDDKQAPAVAHWLGDYQSKLVGR